MNAPPTVYNIVLILLQGIFIEATGAVLRETREVTPPPPQSEVWLHCPNVIYGKCNWTP